MSIKFDERGLAPCIVQDFTTGEVLTLAYVNAESLRLTRETGEMHFYSRSRQELWHKGATSGNTQKVRELRYDCDNDAVLALVDPAGPACHTGERSCFYRSFGFDGQEDTTTTAGVFEIPAGLERTLKARQTERPEGSYTVTLLDDPALIGEKVQEEAEEVSRAAAGESDRRVAEESADVIYHLMVLLRSRNLDLADAMEILRERRR